MGQASTLSFLTMSYIRGMSVAAWISLTVVREWPVVRSDDTDKNVEFRSKSRSKGNPGRQDGRDIWMICSSGRDRDGYCRIELSRFRKKASTFELH